jgi:hypothetical protein
MSLVVFYLVIRIGKYGDNDYEVVVFKKFLDDYSKHVPVKNKTEVLNQWKTFFHSKTRGLFLSSDTEYFLWKDEVNEKLPKSLKRTVNFFDGGNNYESDIEKYYKVTIASVSLFMRKMGTERIIGFLRSPRNFEKWKMNSGISYLYKRRRDDREKIREDLMKVLDIDIVRLSGKSREDTEIFDEATEIQKGHSFSIAVEGHFETDYVSEKIVNSFLSGTIPIYKGSPSINKYFNSKSFINVDDFSNNEELGKYLKGVMEDDNISMKYLSEPPCTEENIKNLLWWRYKNN